MSDQWSWPAILLSLSLLLSALAPVWVSVIVSVSAFRFDFISSSGVAGCFGV
jgi:hypothetical protein